MRDRGETVMQKNINTICISKTKLILSVEKLLGDKREKRQARQHPGQGPESGREKGSPRRAHTAWSACVTVEK